ncbi:MAG: hypothetical protein R2838_07225 [Caldilineaceae bacterium]
MEAGPKHRAHRLLKTEDRADGPASTATGRIAGGVEVVAAHHENGQGAGDDNAKVMAELKAMRKQMKDGNKYRRSMLRQKTRRIGLSKDMMNFRSSGGSRTSRRSPTS